MITSSIRLTLLLVCQFMLHQNDISFAKIFLSNLLLFMTKHNALSLCFVSIQLLLLSLLLLLLLLYLYHSQSYKMIHSFMNWNLYIHLFLSFRKMQNILFCVFNSQHVNQPSMNSRTQIYLKIKAHWFIGFVVCGSIFYNIAKFVS